MPTLPSKEKWEELSKRMNALGIQDADLDESFILGSGKGGQKVNKTHSCVQLKHEPSGIIIKCQKERSRESNRFFARRLLCERLEKPTPTPDAANSSYNKPKNIQWFPGHMAKARRQMEEILRLIDIVVDVRDARAPHASQNPLIDELSARKKRIIVLTKIDLADPKATSQWLTQLNTGPIKAIGINTLDKTNCELLAKTCVALSQNSKKEGLTLKETRVMIAGIPNVGKSALINALAKRKITDVQNRPAVTKRQQWISLGNQLALLDTPGVLWPRFEDQLIGKKLAALGSIKDHLFSKEDISFYLIEFFITHYKKLLILRYGLTEESITTPLETIEAIGIKRACRLRGGDIDHDKVYDILLLDFRRGKLGAISLEFPEA